MLLYIYCICAKKNVQQYKQSQSQAFLYSVFLYIYCIYYTVHYVLCMQVKWYICTVFPHVKIKTIMWLSQWVFCWETHVFILTGEFYPCRAQLGLSSILTDVWSFLNISTIKSRTVRDMKWSLRARFVSDTCILKYRLKKLLT